MAFNSLILDHSIAMIDEGVLDAAACKKSSHVRKDKSICEYYVIGTLMEYSELTFHHKRLSEMCKAAYFKGYSYLVIITK